MICNMDYFKIYADFLKRFLNVKRPLFAVLDAFNGAGGVVAKEVFVDYPLVQLTTINDLPDGDFPAHGPNPLLAGAMKELCQKVVRQKADFGIAFDADGDRALFVDNLGRPVPTYVIAYLIFQHRRPPFVVDELLFKIFRQNKLLADNDLFLTKTEFVLIALEMRSVRSTTSADNFGNFAFEETYYRESGMFTFIRILNLLSSSNKTLADFSQN